MSSDSKYTPEICNALLKYYNTSILTRLDMDSDLKESLYKCADDNMARKGNSLERTVLKELISSHENQENPEADPKTQKPVANFIGGPYTLTLQWSAEYKKLIYIFGETHDKINDCPEEDQIIQIDDYIEQLYKNGDIFCDFYIESGEVFKKKWPYVSRSDPELNLNRTRNKFKDCFDDINSLDCRKGRVHYFDIRNMYNFNYISISYFCLEYYYFSETTNKKVYLDNLTVLFNDDKVLQMFIDISTMNSPEEFIEYLKKDFQANYLFEKELRRSTIAIGEEIKIFFDKLIEDSKEIIKSIKFMESVKELFEKLNNDFVISGKYDFGSLIKYYEGRKDDEEYEEYEDNYHPLNVSYNRIRYLLDIILDLLLYLNCYLIDVYLLGRVFKIFDIDTIDEKKQRITDEPEEPRNIIIYAGNLHSNVYRNFLQKVGFEVIALAGPDWRKSETRTGYNYCIDMRNFPQPFFDYHEKVDWFEEIDDDYDDDDDDYDDFMK